MSVCSSSLSVWVVMTCLRNSRWQSCRLCSEVYVHDREPCSQGGELPNKKREMLVRNFEKNPLDVPRSCFVRVASNLKIEHYLWKVPKYPSPPPPGHGSLFINLLLCWVCKTLKAYSLNTSFQTEKNIYYLNIYYFSLLSLKLN